MLGMESIFEHKNYRIILKEVLSDRMKKNPAFSLRALAKSFECAPSTLSEVIKGKKNLSLESAQTISNKLSFKPEEAEYFSLLVQLEKTKNPEIKERILNSLMKINPRQIKLSLDVDQFKFFSDWYHIAIIQMTFSEDGLLSPEIIANKLQINATDADLALTRLLRLKVLTIDQDNRYRATKKNSIIESSAPNTALQKYHHQIWDKAKAAIEKQTNEEKFVGTETFSFDSEQMAEAKQILNDAFDKILALAKKGKKKKDVYTMGIHFFNLTKAED